MNKEFLDELSVFIDSERILTGSMINEDYSHDELVSVRSLPDILIMVESKEEIVKIVSLCNRYLIPLVVRGSGTGLSGAAVSFGGVMIDTSRMNRILELDVENLCVTVEPGVLLMELNEFLVDYSLFYPPDPGEKTATIGGNISTNAGGMRAVKYGVTRDYIRELKIVTGSGDEMTLGGRVAKNSSGYALKDLVIGSEGTLGIILEATLKLLPVPPVITSLLIPFYDIKSAIETVPKLMRLASIPTAVEFFEKIVISYSEDYLGKKFPDNSSPAYLLLTYDGNSEQEVERQCNEAAELCLNNKAKDVYIVDTKERRDSVWNARGAFLEAIKASAGEVDECDVVVPRAVVADFILYSHEIEKEVDVRISSFGHAGDGNLHIYVCKDILNDAQFQNKRDAAFKLLFEKAHEFGGLVSGEHGIGLAKKDYLKQSVSGNIIDIMRGIKRVFDKNNILNPGKIFD